MDFYRLKQPGSEWFSRQGDAIKASKAAGVEWEKVEVPDSKPERLAWLNENAREGATVTVEATEVSEDVPEPVRPSGKEEHCPKCKFTPRQAEAYVNNKKRMFNVQALKEWIEEREGWELATVIEEITHRLSELAKQATGQR